jgi:hypothetical protein
VAGGWDDLLRLVLIVLKLRVGLLRLAGERATSMRADFQLLPEFNDMRARHLSLDGGRSVRRPAILVLERVDRLRLPRVARGVVPSPVPVSQAMPRKYEPRVSVPLNTRRCGQSPGAGRHRTPFRRCAAVV